MVSDAAFHDVGTPGDYWRTSTRFPQAGAASSSVGSGSSVGRGANRRVRARHSILWDDVEVGAGVVLDECIVTDRVRVPAGASHRRAILVRGEGGEPLASPLNLDP